jgi:hypothetical protein
MPPRTLRERSLEIATQIETECWKSFMPITSSFATSRCAEIIEDALAAATPEHEGTPRESEAGHYKRLWESTKKLVIRNAEEAQHEGTRLREARRAGAMRQMSRPWIDLQDFGAVPKPFSFNEPTAPVSLTAGSKVVVIPPGPFLQSLRAGQGVCVPKAGPPTPQTNPLLAPTATCPATAGTSTFRYQFVGYDARGGLTAASPIGSVSGAAIGPQRIAIKSVSRDATGKMTIETVKPHGFKSQPNSLNQTLIGVEGCSPSNVNGRFVAFWSAITGFDPFPTPTKIICLTDRISAVPAAVVGPASLVSVWGFATVTCPPLSGATEGYYIYADSPNPSGAMKLIGKCYGERHFTDWGPDLAAGYVAPSYVPMTPPTAPQNQLFTTTIATLSSGLVPLLEDPAPTTVSGAMMLFDDGVNLLRAMQASAAGLAGCVWVSPPRVPMLFGGYIFNSPISYPEFINVEWGCHCIFNETATWTYMNEHDSKFGSPQPMQGAQFGQNNYVDIAGIANPIFCIGEDRGNSGSVEIKRLGFTCYSNGQTAVLVRSAFHCKFKDVAFMTGNPTYGTAVGVVCLGSCTEIEFDGTCWQFTNKFQSNAFHPGPPLPALWFRSSDNPNIPNGNFSTNMVLFRGQHTFTGRGILFDHLFASGASHTLGVKIGDFIWNQAASTPMIMCWGQQFVGFEIEGVVNDTSQEAIIANWSTFELVSVRIRNSYNSLQPLTTGRPVLDLQVSASSNW